MDKPINKSNLTPPIPVDPEKVTLDMIMNQMKDAQGYVLFVGIITNNKDKQGHPQIDFQYRRMNFPYVDLKQAAKAFDSACYDDTVRNANAGG